MTFSARVKEELCRGKLTKKCCAVAECYGILLFCNSWTSREARIVTESDAFAKRLPLLFRKAFHMDFDRRPAPGDTGKRVFAICQPGKLETLERCYGYEPGQTVSRTLNFPLVEEECCRASFLRGCFFAGGSITDPAKRYHLELTSSHLQASRELEVLLRECGSSPQKHCPKQQLCDLFQAE